MKTIMIIEPTCNNCGSCQVLQWPHNVQYCRTCGIALVKKGLGIMCIKRYWVTKGNARIKAVKVEKDTGKSIYINGKRRAKYSGWDNYYDTFDQAKGEMVRKAMANVKGCTLRLSEAETFLHKAQAITNDPDYTPET